MFGMTAKQRLAQMQGQKGGTAPEPGKGAGAPKPVPGKLNGGPGPLKKPEPPKAPVVDPKKPVTPQPAKPQEPVKPKEEPKPAAAPEPAKPAAAPEPAKPAAAPEPAKPAAAPESAKPAAAPEPAKPKVEPAKPAAAPEPAKPAAAPEPAKPAAAPEPAKPAAAPEPAKPAAAPEPAKSAAAPEPAKPAAAPEPAKPKEEPKKQAAAPEPAKPAAAPEPAKPKEEHKKPAAAPEPAKPAAAPEPAKPAATPEPAKPKEEPKKPAAAPEPAKPAAAPEPAKPKEEPKKPAAASEPAKPKEEPKKPAAAPEPAKPATAPEPAKSKEEPKKPEPAKAVESPKEPGKPVTKPSEDFFRGIFYFSGMGTLVGSALAEGVYVPEKAQRNAVDGDEIEAAYERQRLRRGEEIIATARNQAQGLSTDFRHLQALLESLPTFTEVLEPQPLDRRAVDQVIHGHVYFQQEQHPAPFQTRAAHHGGEHLPTHPPAAAAEVQSSHQAPVAKHPAGGVAVLPAAFDQKHSAPAKEGSGSFAAAIDEFDRVSATAQQPVFGAHPPAARDSPRPHRRERPTGDVSAAAADADKAAGGARPHGAHTGGQAQEAAPPHPSAWQDRYGQAEVAKFQAPRPFSGGTAGEIDSKGVKSWQLSHLRTLEAKGYQIVAESEGDTVKSYAPYLVSDRSHGVDRQRALHPNFEPIAPRSPAFRSPPAPAQAHPSTFAASGDLPYCDL